MIKPLNIAKTDSTPTVVLDKKTKIFYIGGNILPENPFEFFEPVFEWIKEYSKNPDEFFDLEFSIDIINTASTRRLVVLFKLLEELVDRGTKVKVIWKYLPDDEIMQYTAYEFGNAFKKINFETKLQFNS